MLVEHMGGSRNNFGFHYLDVLELIRGVPFRENDKRKGDVVDSFKDRGDQPM